MSHAYNVFRVICLLRAFEDVQVLWRATISNQGLSLTNDRINLTRELAQTSGITLCRRGEIICTLMLEIQDDEVREARKLSSEF